MTVPTAQQIATETDPQIRDLVSIYVVSTLIADLAENFASIEPTPEMIAARLKSIFQIYPKPLDAATALTGDAAAATAGGN